MGFGRIFLGGDQNCRLVLAKKAKGAGVILNPSTKRVAFFFPQGGPLQVINRVITPINGRKSMGNWSYGPLLIGVITPFITPHL